MYSNILLTKKINNNMKIEEITQNINISERGKASRKLCLSTKPNSSLGASQLSSCKSQGLRRREGKMKHKVGKGHVRVAGKKIKGKQYGGPLPDWSD